MNEEILCSYCGREFYSEDSFEYDEISGRYIKILEDICPNCREDSNLEDED